MVAATGTMSFLLSAGLAAPSDSNPRFGKAPPAIATQGPLLEQWQHDEIIVELRPDRVAAVRAQLDRGGRLPGARTGIRSLDTLGTRHGVTRIDAALSDSARRPVMARSRLERFLLLRLGNRASVLDTLEAYRNDPAVASAQLNYVYAPDVVPNDPLFGQQYSHSRTQAYRGWDIETGDSSIIIAVIGTGVEPTHPDLASKLVAGWDFVDGDADPSPAGDGHETSVAGVAAAATDNGIGIAGVCWGCSIMPLRVSYTSLHVAQAVDFSRTHGARVVNMSFGNYDPAKYGPDTIVETAVDEAYAAGLVLVASAGNDRLFEPRYPGALDSVLSIAATDQNDYPAIFSNGGSWVDASAPGDDLVSTLLTGSGTYGPCSGTSFSAPYVSGLAGLILSKDPSLDPLSVGIIIKATGDAIFEPWVGRTVYGRGRVNVHRALSLVGLPPVFASIDSPWEGLTRDGGVVTIKGTAVGDSYVLETLDYTEGWLEEPSTIPATWVTIATGGQTMEGTLGTWNLDDVAPGQYLLRLTARRGTQVTQHTISAVRTSPQLPGWPVFIGSSLTGEPTLADVDEDGTLEILAGRSDGYVSILRHDGTSLPGWPQYVGGGVYSAPSVGDIDGDGDLEVVAASRFNWLVMAWHHDGTPIAGFPRSTGGSWIVSDPVLASLDADDALEIVIANQDGMVHVLNAPGAVESPGWPRVVESPIPMSPAVGDIDRDGVLDIVVRSETSLRVLKADGTTVAGWPRAAATARGAPAVADLNGDGSLEIIDAALLVVKVWRSDGATFFVRNEQGIDSDHGLALSDVTGDGRPEFFYGNQSNLTYAFNHAAELPGWPLLIGHSTTAGMVIADFDGDTELEVAMPGWDRGVFILNRDGSFSRRPIVVGDELQDTPAVGDLDGDGQNELVVGTLDGWLRVFSLPGSRYYSSGGWPMHQGDAMHTGHYRLADYSIDSDSDSDPDGSDCAPTDPSVHHNAVETCDGIDQDCDGAIDEPFDHDGDGATLCGGDCDDTLATVYPGAPEICDGRNNDCASSVWPTVPAAEWSDGDGDSFFACGDCDDTRSSVRPGAPQICGDGLNNDCNDPAWPSLAWTNDGDPDGDGYSECVGDCNLISGAVWSAPSEARDLRFIGPNTLGWSPPASPGATTVRYALVRMVSPSSFQGATCLYWTGPSLVHSDAPPPSEYGSEFLPPGSFLYYLVRVRNNCPFPYANGPWGFSSSGAEIVGPYCP